MFGANPRLGCGGLMLAFEASGDRQESPARTPAPMRRLLITGTSHVAALRAAWDNLPQQPHGLEVAFLAANATEFPFFTLNAAGVFGLHDESQRSAGQVKLARDFSGLLLRRIADFSHVLIVGHNFRQSSVMRMLQAYRVDGLRETVAPLPRLSQQAYSAFSLALALLECPERLISDLAPLCKLGVVPAPRRSEAILTDATAKPWFGLIASDPSGIRAALNLTDIVVAQACAERGATFFAPPESCLTPAGFTMPEYSRGYVRLSGTTEVDHTHMNADYGAIRLRAIVDWALA